MCVAITVHMSQQFFTNLIEKGMLRITDTGHLQLLNEAMFLTPAPVMVHAYHRACQEMGEEKAAEFFREMGEYQVEQAAERYVEKYNFDEMSKQKIQDFTSKIIRLNGFGNVQFTELDRENESATVKLEESVFAVHYRRQHGEPNHPVDHWLTGLLEKHFGVVFDMNTEVEETSCEAMGDEQCIFKISAKD